MKSKFPRILFFWTIFVALLVFFSVLYPFPVIDGDDINYITNMRPAFPVPGMWNPTRVMPELLMPICGNFAGVMAAIGFGSFIECQVFVVAAVLGLFICFYVYTFQLLLKKRFLMSEFSSLCFAAIFLLLHFLIFRVEDTNNQYMFRAADTCCIFNYTIPAILNCSIIMLLMSEQDEKALFTMRTPFKSSMLVLAVYMAVLSHLYPSTILAIFCGLSILFRFLKSNKKNLFGFIKANSVHFSILTLWVFVSLWEAFGNRAETFYRTDNGGFGNLLLSTQTLISTLSNMSIMYKLLILAVTIATVFTFLFCSSKAERKPFALNLILLLCIGITSAISIIVLSTITQPNYNTRPEVIFPLVFIEFLLLMICAEFVLRHFKFAELLLPLAVLIVFSCIGTEARTFRGSNLLNIDSNVAFKMQNNICNQIVAADEAGLDEVTIYVSLSTHDYWANWPHNLDTGDTLSKFFYKFGIIDNKIDVTMIPSDSFNEQYGIIFK